MKEEKWDGEIEKMVALIDDIYGKEYGLYYSQRSEHLKGDNSMIPKPDGPDPE